MIKKSSQLQIQMNQPTGDGTRARKRNNDFRKHDWKLGSWNVRTMLQAGKMQEIANEMLRFKLNVLALQEIRWKEAGKIDKLNYTLFFSGNAEKSGHAGTGFMISKDTRKLLLGFTPVNERLCSLRLKGKFNNVSIISAYAPTENADEDDKEHFYIILEALIEKVPKYDTILILGDFNAKIGKETFTKDVAGQHSLHTTTSENGLRLCQLAANYSMFISSTHFPHKKIHKGTWTHPGTNDVNQIDHVLVNKRRLSSIIDVRSCRGASCDSDHFMVRVVFRHRLSNVMSAKGRRKRKWNVEKFKNPQTKQIYQQTISNAISHMVTEDNSDTNALWLQIEKTLNDTATATIGYAEKKRNDEWFDKECELAVQKKMEARSKFLAHNTRQSLAEYKRLRSEAKKIIKSKKKSAYNEQINKICDDFDSGNTKAFYQGIRNMKNGFQPRLNNCLDTSGSVLSEEQQILCRWEEYFSKLLNVPDQQFEMTEESNQQTDLISSYNNPPSIEEVDKAMGQIKNNKAPGEDGLVIELFKNAGYDLAAHMHKLISLIWNTEVLPNDWQRGIIIPIHKKGNKMNCENYRGITLLNTPYKILSNILNNRLKELTESIIGEYQCGFRPNRSTTDQIFLLRHTMEKCYEYKRDLHMLMIDFKQAFDSINRECLEPIMLLMGIPRKLIKLVVLTLRKTTCRVALQNKLTEEFDITSGVRQGDALSTTIFNIIINHAIASIDRGGHIFSKSTIICAYADDIALISHSMRELEENFMILERETRKLGLVINENKTKYMFMSSKPNENVQQHSISLLNYTFEIVNSFNYLGAVINNKNDMHIAINERLQAAQKTFYAHLKFFKSRLTSRSLKMRLYKTVVLPVLTYSCETWALTLADEEKLRVFERKIIRKIYGPVRDEEGAFRRRSNQEIEMILNGQDVVRFIKTQRLRWAGHVARMPDNRAQKRILNAAPYNTRRRGKPRTRWLDGVEYDCRKVNIDSWRQVAQDRSEWRKKVNEVKAHTGL